MSMFVCMHVCNTVTFKSLDVESSFFVCGYIFMRYRSRLYMKVIGSQEQKVQNFLFSQCKTSLNNNSAVL